MRKRRVEHLEHSGELAPETPEEREERLRTVREQAERANDGHLRTVARVRRRELIREAGGAEGLDLSEGAVLDGDEELPFSIGKDGSVACSRDGRAVTDGRHVFAEDMWWFEVGWLALDLVRGGEPGLTLGEDGTLRTTDGRAVLTRERYDMAARWGPETKRQQEAMAEHHEAWLRFLAADDAGAAALDKLREIPEDLDAPRGFVTPISDEYTEEEADAFGDSPMKPYPLFSDAEEREAVRRLAWALLYDAGARALLSELTRRRDAFAAEDPSE